MIAAVIGFIIGIMIINLSTGFIKILGWIIAIFCLPTLIYFVIGLIVMFTEKRNSSIKKSNNRKKRNTSIDGDEKNTIYASFDKVLQNVAAQSELSGVAHSYTKNLIQELKQEIMLSEESYNTYKNSASETGWNVDTVAYMAVVSNCANELESGRCHVYRGVLDNEGQELRKLLAYLLNKVNLLGAKDRQWTENYLKTVDNNIKNVG
ncbi:MAG: hypothetical protein U5P10_16440 [Spirochaetia bacterium]|nr:hypothetical protein [Spirochaetia bacterium]